MGIDQSVKFNRLKLSVFAEKHWPDEESRPCTATIKNHIKEGLLSGEKKGGLWFVLCTLWNEPVYYYDQKPENTEPDPDPAPVINTGNAKADNILKQWCK